MSWPLIVSLVLYLVGALAVWSAGTLLVGESASGRKSVPAIAALWPVFAVLVVIVLILCGIDHICSETIAERGLADGKAEDA